MELVIMDMVDMDDASIQIHRRMRVRVELDIIGEYWLEHVHRCILEWLRR